MDNIVCRLPGITLPKDAEFSVEEKYGVKRLRGSSGNVSYEGELENPTKYALAIEAEDGTLKLVPTTVTDLVAKASLLEKNETDAEQQELWRQRTALGETFGTKKAKSALADRSRNRLDADSLENLEDAIVDRVKVTTADLPSEQDRQKTIEEDRHIPPYNLETKIVKDIYPLSELVSPMELGLIDVSEVISAAGTDNMYENLYKSNSRWINLRVAKVVEEKVDLVNKLRQLSYLSLLLKVYDNRRINNKLALMEKLGSPPEPVIAGLIERFTVGRAGFVGKSRDRSFAFDPAHIDKLLAYILVLALHIDEFELEVTPLAHEVGLAPYKLVNLVRNLGCTIKVQGSGKIAKLTAPLILPERVKRGGAKR